MADKQTQALGRLTKKLSALRKTLGKDERIILDQLILGADADVAGHAMASAKAPKPAARVAEVAGHAMTTAKTPRPAARVAEVAGHAMTSAKTPKPAARVAEV